MNKTYRSIQSVPGFRRQRGVAAVYAGVAIVALVASMALAVDVGQLYYAQRNLQRSATFAALDGVRTASGCSAGNGLPGSLSQVSSKVAASLAANDATSNGYNQVVPTLVPYPGQSMVETGTLLTDGKGGTNTTIFRQFTPLADGDPKTDSVRVNLARAQPALFIPFLAGGADGGGLLRASATARQIPVGTFSVGTEIASLNGGLINNILGPLLCAPGDLPCQAKILALNVAGSTAGLAQVGVSLGQLATSVGLSAEDLANPVTLATTAAPLSQILGGLAASVGVSADVSGLLQNLAAASTNPNTVPLGQLLGTVDGIAANVPFTDLLDLILALGESATAASGGGVTPISLPASVSIPGATATYAFLSIGSPPRFGNGRAGTAYANTAEITIQVRSQLNALSTVSSALAAIPLLSSIASVNVSSINLGIDVAVAPAKAFLDTLNCPGVGSPSPVAYLSAAPALATVSIGTFSGDPKTAPALTQAAATLASVSLKVLGGAVASANLNVVLNQGAIPVTVGNSTPIDLQAVRLYDRVTPATVTPTDQPYFAAMGAPGNPTPTPVADNPQTVGSSGLFDSTFSSLTSGLTSNLSTVAPGGTPSQICVLLVGCVPVSSLLNPIVAGVVNTITPALTGVSGILDGIVDPLLASLGIQVGSATVTMTSVDIAPPQLVTTCRPDKTGCY